MCSFKAMELALHHCNWSAQMDHLQARVLYPTIVVISMLGMAHSRGLLVLG